MPVCVNPFAGDLSDGHCVFLRVLAEQMASGFAEKEKAVCSRALGAFAEWHEENQSGEEPLLRDFYGLLREPPFEDEGIGRGIARRISQYVGKGEYAGFVDGRNALDITNDLTVFELAGLDKAKDLQSVLVLTLMYRLLQRFTNLNVGNRVST